uniref:Uncharacterized protein n=1 Tax=Rhodnius prolixus TaxID=13249 RepID=T1I7J0_RHOPR
MFQNSCLTHKRSGKLSTFSVITSIKIDKGSKLTFSTDLENGRKTVEKTFFPDENEVVRVVGFNCTDFDDHFATYTLGETL